MSLIAAALIALAPAPAPQGDIMCSALRQVEGGKYTFTMERGYSVADEVAKPGPFVNDRGKDVVGFVCLRENTIPRVDDVEVLQAGFTFYVGDVEHEKRMVVLDLVDGRVTSNVLNGELTPDEDQSLARVVVAMQLRVDNDKR